MPSLIRHLPKIQQQTLFKNLNYMNMQELKGFLVIEHTISYLICYEDKDGGVHQTRDSDRKAIILDRIKHFLQTGDIKKKQFFQKQLLVHKLPGKLDQSSCAIWSI